MNLFEQLRIVKSQAIGQLVQNNRLDTMTGSSTLLLNGIVPVVDWLRDGMTPALRYATVVVAGATIGDQQAFTGRTGEIFHMNGFSVDTGADLITLEAIGVQLVEDANVCWYKYQTPNRHLYHEFQNPVKLRFGDRIHVFITANAAGFNLTGYGLGYVQSIS